MATLTLLLFPVVFGGAEDYELRVRVALALASTGSESPDPPPIPPEPPRPRVPARPPSYSAMRARSASEGKPLVVWVGCHDVAAERELSECLHVRVSAFPGVAGCGIVVGVPRGGEVYRVDDLPEGASAGRVRAAFARDPSGMRRASSPAYYAPPVYSGGVRCGPGG